MRPCRLVLRETLLATPRGSAAALGTAALFCAAALFGPVAVLEAQLAAKTTGGTLELQIISDDGLDREAPLPIEFVWHPDLDPDDTGYRVTAECFRFDRLGRPPGSTNKLRFDLRMTTLGSGEVYRFAPRRRKLARDGLQKRVAAWGSDALEAAARQGAEGGIFVELEISARQGRLAFGDTLRCSCAVTESGRPVLGVLSSARAAGADSR